MQNEFILWYFLFLYLYPHFQVNLLKIGTQEFFLWSRLLIAKMLVMLIVTKTMKNMFRLFLSHSFETSKITFEEHIES